MLRHGFLCKFSGASLFLQGKLMSFQIVIALLLHALNQRDGIFLRRTTMAGQSTSTRQWGRSGRSSRLGPTRRKQTKDEKENNGGPIAVPTSSGKTSRKRLTRMPRRRPTMKPTRGSMAMCNMGAVPPLGCTGPTMRPASASG